MCALIRVTPLEIDDRLNDFGIVRDQLIAIVHAMVAAKAECTDNDPPSAPGWSSWRHGTRRAREIFRSKGWLKDDAGLSTIVNHSLGMRIAVANTDDATGIASDEVNPQNVSRKGAATDRAVDGNQKSLFRDLPPDEKIIPFVPRERHTSAYATYYVCVFGEGVEVRAEFSCPIKVVDGFFVGFSERIILVKPGEWPPAPMDKREEPDSDVTEFDIPVRRK